jgi:hypothetical protein
MAPSAPVATIAVLTGSQCQTGNLCPTNMQSLDDCVVGCTVFSKIGLLKAYHQSRCSKNSYCHSFCLFEILVMAFGLKNASHALQRLKDNILMGLDYAFFLFR